MNTTPPILLIVFNRLDNTKSVFGEIKKIKPKKLYISSDGPRENIEGEKLKVQELRKFLLDAVDWDCEIKTFFHETNQGCKQAPHEAISWFFENEESGIILEDDCVPSYDFFKYTSALLARYEDDLRIFGISGTNFQSNKFKLNESYYFSRFFMTWGWATWRSRWHRHLEVLKDFETYIQDYNIGNITSNKVANTRVLQYAKKGFNDELDAWDYQWILSCMINNGLIAIPAVNLVENIGFGPDATHTTSLSNRQIQAREIEFPLRHPKIITPNIAIDNSFYKNIFGWLTAKEKLTDLWYWRAAIKARINGLF